ncbi:MAG: methylmalonyl-CoA epimerase [Candidatus Marinimicrobia bacterium]|jgi:methylmalonyl-CoA/ethylmalonyl-CoA epimerase|nr:methylmalonyl-CoA epimerase [Candidatus Neomarinimicrobiota bacterium]|tara:strand:- start:2662 stop:3081 length:420 start_codon:yes stop_codon:yes gene_type:complete
MSKLPFKVLGIEHVALAVKDVDAPSNLFGSLLGIEHTSSEEITDQKVNTHIFDTTYGKIELLNPISDDSPISKFLENRGEGIHHIAFKVDKLQPALDYLKDNGIQLIDETPKIGAEGLLVAFLHPKSTYGVLIELCQQP